MSHDHDHDGGGHAGHSHGVSADADARFLTIALLFNASFMVVEIVIGIAASSIALLSDAGHMVTDVGAIGLALWAAKLARRAPKGSLTFGYKRAEILSALANGATLLLLAAYFIFEAGTRLFDPPTVEAGLVFWVGLAGLGANGGAAYFLAKASRQSLNVQGAVQHNLIDAFGSIAAAAAAAVILLTDFQQADPIASLIISALMVRSGWALVRDSGRVLLEAAPRGLEPRTIGGAMAASPGIVEVHDLHIWELTTDFTAMSAHVLVAVGDDCHARRRELEELLGERFGIEHTTLQVDHEPAEMNADHCRRDASSGHLRWRSRSRSPAPATSARRWTTASSGTQKCNARSMSSSCERATNSRAGRRASRANRAARWSVYGAGASPARTSRANAHMNTTTRFVG